MTPGGGGPQYVGIPMSGMIGKTTYPAVGGATTYPILGGDDRAARGGGWAARG